MGNTKERGRKRKRQFHGNRFTSESVQDEDTHEQNMTQPAAISTSSSDKLLDLSFEKWTNDSSGSDSDSDSSNDGNHDDEEDMADRFSGRGFRIVGLALLFSAISSFRVCKACRSGSIVLKEGRRYGLAVTIVFNCSDCAAELSVPLPPKIPGGSFLLNRLVVFAMRFIGRGRQTLVKFCTGCDMPPPMSRSSFAGHQAALHKAAKDVAGKSMGAAGNALKGTAGADVAVTADGTWMRHGFASLYGAMSVIGWKTGQVLDVYIASRFCSACSKKSSERREGAITAEEHQAWKDTHKPDCAANYSGSAPAMESAAAVKLWGQSVENHGLRYTEYIGDGDFKGHASVVKSAPYGPGVSIEKLECVGHVQKRMGHRLRELVKKHSGSKLSDGKAIGGRGRLTGDLIQSLQNWYGSAIRDNRGDYRAMAKAVWASICHRASTDEKPRHEFCPRDGWCAFHKATPDKPYKHHDPIPQPIFDLLLLIYRDLAEKQLLLRCEKGTTQNRNEAFNKLVWSYLPKTEFAGAAVVDVAIYLAVIHFNHGIGTFQHLLAMRDCTRHGLEQLDASRLENCLAKCTADAKARRKRLRRIKKGLEDEYEEEEGTTYGAGQF